ncbi:hypothetical protein [Pseudoxanthomonas putridarboris]|uniref:TonB-dependent receptor n=1 Tax=Pseudoxanthomonas putridarboris TaxID=752605 RepID=A0ABU9J690_9GAMM
MNIHTTPRAAGRASRTTVLSRALRMALTGGLLATVPAAWAQAPAQDEVSCDQDGCSDAQTLVRIRTEGKRQPRAAGDSAAALQDNRRVDVALPPQAGDAGRKVAQAVGRFAYTLPNGGMIWAIEDPALVTPVLNAGAGSSAPVQDGKLSEPVQFSVYSNYAKFIDRLELSIYRATDTDLVSPLATLAPQVGNVIQATWDGTTTDGRPLRVGDELLYVLRAYDAQGHFDETQPRTLALMRPADHARNLTQLSSGLAGTADALLTGQQAQAKRVEETIFGDSQLRLQNIPLQGSRVRVLGQDIPADQLLEINGQAYPVDLDRKFVAEFLLPVGQHTLELALGNGTGEPAVRHPLTIDVTGKYFFAVGLADVTASDSKVGGGNRTALELGDDSYDDFLVDGRLAFYLKAKARNKYLFTAQADTGEKEIGDLFTGFLDKDPQDVFRRLDPDMYYPVYGDDSTTYRDVDTMGRLYLRMDWGWNQALWGNYDTGLTGTELSQYARSLYGAALAWRSEGANAWGDPKSLWRVFGSETQTALGHTELLGTGGSVYYLKHTDLLPGSDKIVLEVRDRTTGRAESRIQLVSGVDYEIDALQGRIILSRPLSQLSQINQVSIIRDRPLAGYEQRLVADYEYIPSGFEADQVTAGVRGKQWFGDHLGVGLTYVDERRSGDDYTLAGGDVTLQAGRGTYLKLEYAQTESTQSSVFYSDNGGLSFTQINPALDAQREGDAFSVEARANFRELGWTSRDWTVGGWWRELGHGYSSVQRDPGQDLTEQGVEFSGQITDTFRLAGRASKAELGNAALEQLQVLGDWDITERDNLTGEIRRVRESVVGSDADGLLAALQYTRRVAESLELYGIVQHTLDDDDGRYADNDAYTLGARYLFGDRSTLAAEHTWGDRGDGTSVDLNYQVSNDYSVYGRYTWSTDTSERLFDNRGNDPAGLTVGQRWRVSNQVSLYSESQQLKEGSETGIAHTYGMDFALGRGWSTGFTLQNGELDAAAGEVKRNAASISGSFRSADVDWSSRLEYRKDTGAERRETWASVNRLMYRINQDWRIAARINYADTDDEYNPLASARFTEANLGFAWRPHDSTRWALLGKYTYLYDLRSLGQDNSGTDQRSQVFSLEGAYQPDQHWEFVGKLARREGEARVDRGTGPWYDSAATFAALQARYHLPFKWDALAEYRWLNTDVDDGTRTGWLLGVDRAIGPNFRVGVGYNFTDFSSDLTDHDYDHRGWFLNFVGSY